MWTGGRNQQLLKARFVCWNRNVAVDELFIFQQREIDMVLYVDRWAVGVLGGVVCMGALHACTMDTCADSVDLAAALLCHWLDVP